jgi:hypothetical protein
LESEARLRRTVSLPPLLRRGIFDPEVVPYDARRVFQALQERDRVSADGELVCTRNAAFDAEKLLHRPQNCLWKRDTKRAHLPKVQQQNGHNGEAVCENLYSNYMPPPLVYSVTHTSRHSNNCQLGTLSKTLLNNWARVLVVPTKYYKLRNDVQRCTHWHGQDPRTIDHCTHCRLLVATF